MIDRAVSICKKSNTLIIAGTGTNNTAESSYFTSLASQLKIDACLVVTPYYNKPSQEGLRQHFLEVAESTKNNIPIILYNVPSRTSVSLAPTTVSALSTHKKIIGIKEASANLALFTEMRRAVRRTKPENNFYFLSGDDATFWPFLASGGDGVISVTSNLVPNSMRVLFENWQDRKLIGGLTLFEKMFPLFTQLFIDSNPVPLKHLMGFLKIIPPYCRLPLSKLSDFNASKLLKTWKSLHSSIKEDRPVQNSK